MTEAETETSSEALKQWADNQRALARALGLSIDDWLGALDQASARSTGLTAAVVGAAMARGLTLGVLSEVDPERLKRLARALIDPKPPRAKNPLLKEAIRRADDLGVTVGAGARRLKGARARDSLPTPVREIRPLGESAAHGTPDAPGAPRRRRSTGKGRAREGAREGDVRTDAGEPDEE